MIAELLAVRSYVRSFVVCYAVPFFLLYYSFVVAVVVILLLLPSPNVECTLLECSNFHPGVL